MMLLAASPGGTSANLFSHLFRGDVALNITLTAINSVIAIVTLPLITSLAIGLLRPRITVSLPVREGPQGLRGSSWCPWLIGMVVRARAPAFATRMDRPVRIGSPSSWPCWCSASSSTSGTNVGGYFADVGLVAAALLRHQPRRRVRRPAPLGVATRRRSPARWRSASTTRRWPSSSPSRCSTSAEMSVPAAVYGLVMLAMAAVWGFVLTRYVVRTAPPLMR